MSLTGNVSRWFNRKGFGFINVVNSDSDLVGQDLFVHLSGINVAGDGYKSLYPGEYVNFDLGSGRDGRPTCVNVTGVCGGLLLVEHPEYRFKYFQKDRQESNDSNGPAPDPVTDEVPAEVPDEVQDEVQDDDENDPQQHA